MTVEQLAAARGMSVQDVLDACGRSGVLAWSGFTPLDEAEVAKVDAALAAPAGGAGAPGWAAPGVGGPPPPPTAGGPPPPPPPPGFGQPAPYRPVAAPRGGGGGRRVVGIIVAVLVSIGVRVGIASFFDGDDDEDRSRDAVADVIGADADDDVDDSLAAFALVVGDCFDDLSGIAPDATQSVEARLEEVPCDGAHDAEVYATPLHPDPAGAPFPGDDAVAAFAEEACYSQFAAFVGVPFEQSTLSYYYTFPQVEGWDVLDDRTIACSVVTPDGSQLTGSMAGSQR